MSRYAREDEDFERTLERLNSEDPELSAEDLAEIARCDIRHMRNLLSGAKVGRLVWGPYGKKRVVKWSELVELKGDYELHRILFR